MEIQMRSKGIRILDKDDGVVTVTLFDILKDIKNGEEYTWSILLLDGVGKLGNGKSMVKFMDEIDNSEKGFFIDWPDLLKSSKNDFLIIDLVLIGGKNDDLLHRYDDEV